MIHVSVSEPFPEQFNDDLFDAEFLLDPDVEQSAHSGEEYQPTLARPDLIGEASEGDVVDQAHIVWEVDDEEDI